MYYEDNENGIWSLSELVTNEKKDKEIHNDLLCVLKDQDRYAREYFSDMYFDGIKHGYDLYHTSRNDYMNCCLEDAIRFSKEIKMVNEIFNNYKRLK